MSTDQPTGSAVVHHHHYYGSDHTPAPRPAWNPQCRRQTPARTGTSPALLLAAAAGAGIAIALVVAVTVATALAVLIGLVALVVLGARHYVQIERDARTVPQAPRRDARGRFTA